MPALRMRCTWSLLTLLAGCESQRLVEIEVRGLTPQVESLDVAMWLPGRSTEERRAVTRSLGRFFFSIEEQAQGLVQVHVSGLGKDGCMVAAGDAALDLRPAAQALLAVDLVQRGDGCNLNVRRVGDGRGTVAAESGGASLPCEGPCGGPSQRPFAAGQQVTLVAQPTAGSYFAGWSGACSGADSCTVTVTGVPQQIEAAFGLRRACEGPWCWDSPTPHGYQLHDLWGAAANDIWAVGARGALLHYNGSFWVRWQRVSEDNLTGIFGLPGALRGEGAPRPLLWAVGERGTILRFDGHAWAKEESGVPEHLRAVWASSPTNAWAAGQRGALTHWDGRSWRRVDSGVTTTLNALWGSGPGEVFAAGGGLAVGNAAGDEVGTILRFDGNAWCTAYSAPTGRSQSFQDLWGVEGPEREVWAVGMERSAGTFQSTGIVYRLRGESFTAEPGLPAADGFSAVWGRSARDVWLAAGNRIFRVDGSGYRGFTGIGWSQGTATALWGSASADVWAAGSANNLLQWNGLSWARRSGGFLGSLAGIHGRGPQEVVAVGLGTPVLQYDGELWSAQGGDPSLQLYGVWAGSEGDTWYVGAGGAIFFRAKETPEVWSRIVPTTALHLLAVWGSSRDNVWAVGGGGKIVRLLKRAPYVEEAPPLTQESLLALWGSSPGDIWAVGTGGTAVRYDGVSWRPYAVPTRGDLWGVWGSRSDDVWAAGLEPSGAPPGTAPVLLHFANDRWERVSGLPDDGGVSLEALSGVWGDGAGNVWVSSIRGVLRRQDGRWTLEGPGIGLQRQLWGTDSEHLWGVGLDGAIVRRGRP